MGRKPTLEMRDPAKEQSKKGHSFSGSTSYKEKGWSTGSFKKSQVILRDEKKRFRAEYARNR